MIDFKWIVIPVAICAFGALLVAAGICFWRRQKVSPRLIAESQPLEIAKPPIAEAPSQTFDIAEDASPSRNERGVAAENATGRSLERIASSSSIDSSIDSSDDDENTWKSLHLHKRTKKASGNGPMRAQRKALRDADNLVSWGAKSTRPEDEDEKVVIEVSNGLPRGLRMVSGPIPQPQSRARQSAILFENKRPQRQI
jgi:hypothetical protein